MALNTAHYMILGIALVAAPLIIRSLFRRPGPARTSDASRTARSAVSFSARSRRSRRSDTDYGIDVGDDDRWNSRGNASWGGGSSSGYCGDGGSDSGD